MFQLILPLIRAPLRTRESLILENVALRHQLQILNRGNKRLDLKNRDCLVWILPQRGLANLSATEQSPVSRS